MRCMKKNKISLNRGSGVAVLVILVALIFVLPLRLINWGKINIGQDQGITVVGEASSKEKNQIASFSAGVSVDDKDKSKAVGEVNEKINKLVSDLKEFGINEDDIKTRDMSIHEGERYETREKLWYASNNIEIILRDLDKANDLADLLSQSGATNVYGPNLRMDDTSDIEKSLYDSALSDAREKAELIAKASGRKLGKVLSVVEGSGGTYDNVPILRDFKEGLGGASIEPGTSTVSKTLTVVFELK